MNGLKDGGPAFPRPASENTSGGTVADGDYSIEEQSGMSLRDAFAKDAPVTFCDALTSLRKDKDISILLPDIMRELSKMHYLYADAMLEARKK